LPTDIISDRLKVDDHVQKYFAPSLFFVVADRLLGKSQLPLRYLVQSWSPTCFEPASVMEFGFKYLFVTELNNSHLINRRVFFDYNFERLNLA